jgi:hypothetical protein
MADPEFQHRVFLKINSIQRYKKYIISTHIYQYILAFSIENRPEYSQEYRSTCERHCIQLDYQKIKLKKIARKMWSPKFSEFLKSSNRFKSKTKPNSNATKKE